jgi:hypothetical protein
MLTTDDSFTEEQESKSFASSVERSPDELPDFGDYAQRLLEAKAGDLGAMERKGVVGLGVDSVGRRSIFLIPALALKDCANDTEKMAMMRNVMLLFIRIADEIVDHPYTLVYGHSATPLLAQTKVLHSYYKILPRKYKKNLKEMILLHPTFGIRTFFDISRYFIGDKFFRKLHFVDRIAHFQSVVSPLQVRLPPAFIMWEEQHYKYTRPTSPLPPLTEFVNASKGNIAPKFLISCVEFMKRLGAERHEGLFRVPGDHELMNLALDRLRVDGGERSILFSAPMNDGSSSVSASKSTGVVTVEKCEGPDDFEILPERAYIADGSVQVPEVPSEALNFENPPVTSGSQAYVRAVLVIEDINSVATVCDIC